jgi:probable FeS assembly SUF system protein SufT
MNAQEHAVLSREVRAVEIPQGTPVVVASGTHVRITQSLGGSYTVMTEYGQLLRLDPKDADAIGKEVPAVPAEGEAQGPLEDQVWAQLRTCFDPEIPVNIVDLGLVYLCDLQPHEGGGYDVKVKMTLTAPGCGMGEILAADVREKVGLIPTVARADVELVFDPPWNQSMMSEEARLEAGLL